MNRLVSSIFGHCDACQLASDDDADSEIPKRVSALRASAIEQPFILLAADATQVASQLLKLREVCVTHAPKSSGKFASDCPTSAEWKRSQIASVDEIRLPSGVGRRCALAECPKLASVSSTSCSWAIA
ncbi:MAG: hypothetical protein WBD20_20585 [Pirellulaceae bacterium]